MIVNAHGHWRAPELKLVETEAESNCTCGWRYVAKSGSRCHMKKLSEATLEHVRTNQGHEVQRQTTITAFYQGEDQHVS